MSSAGSRHDSSSTLRHSVDLVNASPSTSRLLSQADNDQQDGESIAMHPLPHPSSKIPQPKVSPESSTQRKEGGRQHHWTRIWAWELLSSTFSLACISAVVIILLCIQNKPLESWKFPLQPNTLVSIFSTFSKSALLVAVAEGISQLKWIYFRERRHRLYDLQVFEYASRGPWGSLTLLAVLRLQAVVASFGAVITIASLAMDPFVQEVLAYPFMTMDVAGIASIATASSYDWGNWMGSSVESSMGWDVVGDMSTSTFVGMFSQSFQVPFQCSTGNCTWPAYSCLGVCSSCEDYTDTIRTTCSGGESGMGTQVCSYKFPNGDVISANASNNPGPTRSAFRSTLLNVTTPNSEEGSDSATITNLTAVWFSGENPDVDEWRLTAPTAYQCELYWCRRKFENTTVASGILSEQQAAPQRLVLPPCYVYDSLEAFVGHYLCPAYPVGKVPHDYNSSQVYSASNDLDPDANWINNVNIGGVFTWAQNIFTLSTNTQEIGDAEVNQNILAKMLWTISDGDLPKTFDAIAAAISQQIRVGPNQTAITGTGQRSVPFIRVRWAWMSLPIAVVLLSIVFLAVSVAFSLEDGQLTWKTSALAAYYHPLESLTIDEHGMDTLEAMEDASKKETAVLGPDANGHTSMLR